MNGEKRSDLDIDINDLHHEWESQPRLYHKAASRLADAKQDLDLAEARLKVIEAELARDIRRSPSDFDLLKAPSVDVVKATIPLQARHQAAVEAVIKAQYAVGIVTAKVGGMSHKKAALEDLVKLRLADYFAEPRKPQGEAGQAFADEEKQRLRSRGKKSR